MLGGYLGASVEVGGANARNAASRLWSAEIHLRFPVAHDPVMIHKFHLPFHAITSHKLVVTSYADGSGGPHALRTSPLASELLLTCAALPLAGAASPLTCPPAAANPSSFAALTTPGRLRSLRSASSLPFLVTCQRQVIPSHSFAALTALVVRRVNSGVALFVRRINGFADRPMPACTGRPHAPRRGIGVRTRQRHLAAARAKKNLKLCAKQLEVKKFPAPCYSPIVNYTVPSPLEPLTTVFGKGTCVSAPLSAPEKITIKKTSPGIISKIQSSRLSNIC